MRPRSLQPHSLWSDLDIQYQIFGFSEVDEDDQVNLTMTPQFVTWDDYGMHSRTFPAAGGVTPWLRYNSNDGTDYVTLTGEGQVNVHVPASLISPMGPGMVDVVLSYQRLDTDARRTLVHWRLPLMDTGGG